MKLDKSQLFDKKKMKAVDMFLKDMVQIFSKRTGEYLGYVREGEDLDDPEIEEPEIVQEKPNNKQLNLF